MRPNGLASSSDPRPGAGMRRPSAQPPAAASHRPIVLGSLASLTSHWPAQHLNRPPVPSHTHNAACHTLSAVSWTTNQLTASTARRTFPFSGEEVFTLHIDIDINWSSIVHVYLKVWINIEKTNTDTNAELVTRCTRWHLNLIEWSNTFWNYIFKCLTVFYENWKWFQKPGCRSGFVQRPAPSCLLILAAGLRFHDSPALELVKCDLPGSG